MVTGGQQDGKRIRQDNRRQQLLFAAATLFASHGYKATSMRDIADAAGMLAGSIYYHFKSKEDLLVAVHEEAQRRHELQTIQDDGRQAGPWMRLELACTAHLESVLGDPYAAVALKTFPQSPPALRARLVQVRDRQDNVFRRLIDDLPLPATADRKVFRLMLLGALNDTRSWAEADSHSPAELSRLIVSVLRPS